MLNSPLAATMRMRVFHMRTRQRPRERVLRAIAAVGALVLHLVFLIGFVLGPAYQVKPPHETKDQFLQVRLIEPPEPPPPPPVRGTPPKERGPRHQGRRSTAATSTEPSATAQLPPVAKPTQKAITQVVAKSARATAKVAKPVAAPPPPAALPQPAPTPDLQPIPLASEPPAVELPTPVLQPPVPPKFQPESVRKPQLEGNQAMLPPSSLAVPQVPPEAAPPITLPSIVLNTEVPKSSRPAGVQLAHVELSGAPAVPELQPVPLPAQPSPQLDLQAQAVTAAPTVPQQRPRIQAPTVDVAQAEREAVPVTPADSAVVEPQAPAAKINVADTAPKQITQPSIAPAQLSAPAVETPVTSTPQPAATSEPAKPSSASAASQPAAAETRLSPGDVSVDRDVSTAPDATPQGSTTARPGEPSGTPEQSLKTAADSSARQPAAGQAGEKSDTGSQQGKGQSGGNRPGADQGDKQGVLGGYVQLKPHGDTDIMRHGGANIGYKPTRFEQDWAPEGESSIDTALRHAVEKTTVSHTFHLPRGVRIKCAVMPLLPMALLGCSNPDPPAKALSDKAYDRLHLRPANPLVPPAPASSPVRAAMAPIDNSAECSVARVSGAPPPPGCQVITLPVKPSSAPASSSTSWVPASDQFH